MVFSRSWLGHCDAEGVESDAVRQSRVQCEVAVVLAFASTLIGQSHHSNRMIVTLLLDCHIGLEDGCEGTLLFVWFHESSVRTSGVSPCV